jgi:hypothetical protein
MKSVQQLIEEFNEFLFLPEYNKKQTFVTSRTSLQLGTVTFQNTLNCPEELRIKSWEALQFTKGSFWQ